MTTEFFQAMDRAVVGTHLYPGLALRSGAGRRYTTERPAPTIGQDNGDVFGALGFSAERVEALRRSGIIGERPA